MKENIYAMKGKSALHSPLLASKMHPHYEIFFIRSTATGICYGSPSEAWVVGTVLISK